MKKIIVLVMLTIVSWVALVGWVMAQRPEYPSQTRQGQVKKIVDRSILYGVVTTL